MYLSSTVLDRGVIRLRKDEKHQASNDYATGDHLCQIFQEDMQSLYRLAPGNRKSRTCRAMLFRRNKRCPQRVHGSQKMGAPWSRQIAIKNAIRLISATPAKSHEQRDRWAQADDRWATCTTIRAVIQLASLCNSFQVCTGYGQLILKSSRTTETLQRENERSRP